MRYLIVCLLGAASAFIVNAQDSISTHYKIYNTKTRTIISPEEIASGFDADVVFFGEEHNDSAGHYLENRIFQSLFAKYNNKLALSLEMFESDNQVVLNEYLNGWIDESRLSKDARLWSNYKDYRPMIEFAKRNKIPVIAANTPRRYVNLVSRRGMRSLDSLDKTSKQWLPPLPYDTLQGRYREKFSDIMKGSPGASSANIYYSQSLWDAGMSYNIYRFMKQNKGSKVLHCVGKFHVEEWLGTAAQLKMRNHKLRILTVICFPDDSFDHPDWDKLSSLGDVIIITDPKLKRTY